MITDIYAPEYYRQGKPPPPAWPAADPPPIITTRDVRPDVPVPGPVVALEARGRAKGWEVRIGYSRSPERAVRVGTYKDTEAWCVQGLGNGWRWSALYTRTVGRPWSWRSTAIWRPVVYGRFTHALITDLQAFIDQPAIAIKPWFKGIEAREIEKAEVARERAKQRRVPGRKDSAR